MGCGALKFLDKEHGEFKSIRIHDKFRGKGYGIKIINHLINEAKNLNIRRISIETGSGDFFAPARKLFDNCGFKSCPPFAHYKEDVNSLYLTKLINISWIFYNYHVVNLVKKTVYFLKKSPYYLIISNKLI